MRPASLRDMLTSPWLYVCLLTAAIFAGVVLLPMTVGAMVVGAAAAAFLIWRFGTVRGLWYVVLLTLPLKEPMSFDIHGTVSVYLTDAVLVFLFARVVASTGLRELWRGSATLRVTLVILALSTAGLYTATKFFWGVAGVYRILMLVLLFGVARVLVTDRSEARRALVMVALSLVVPVIVGLYQASLPFGAVLPDWGNVYTAYDASGRPSHRVFSTLNHPLNFSHLLTVGFALSLALANGARRTWERVALLAAAGFSVLCNLYTYSAGGVLGMLGATVTFVLLRRTARLVVAILLVLVVVALIAPPALVDKIDRLTSGEALTAAARIVTYQQSFLVLRDHPVFGLGWGSIRTSLEGAYRISRADPVAFTAENYFLQRAIALGLVGLGLFVAMWVLFLKNVLFLRRTWRASGAADPLSTALLTAAAAFLIQAQVIPATNVSANSVLWLLFAIAEGIRYPLTSERPL